MSSSLSTALVMESNATTGATGTGTWEVSTTITDTVMKILYVVIGCIGMLGNALVVVVIFSFTNMRRKLANVFIINQSVIDFLLAVTLLLTTLLPDDGRVYASVTDDAYCRVWVGRVPLWTFIHGSTFSLVALTLERYASVIYPVAHHNSFTRVKAAFVIAGVWALAILYDTAGSLSTSHIKNGACVLFSWKSQDAQLAVGILGACLNYFVPIFILIFCYGRMAYYFSMKVLPLTGGGGTSNGQGGTGNAVKSLQSRGKKNVVKALVIVSVAFILCTSWNQWFFFLFNFGVFDYTTLNSTFYHFSVAAMFANCCVNPFIYAAKYQEFQRGLRKMLRGCRRGDPEVSSGGNTSIASAQ